ncbi:TPA: hypothetical protein MCT11_005402 [Klebsiella pneumoniae]|nr:hypothetical protein [Klebsiella pneumoniae]NPC31558.1 hypothetical protein [Escherichia coli]HAL7493350.1 hypothetical protein [Escherichia coli]HAW2750369.1 hypothetical protein [Escherichia coli]HAX7030722.1 hypothetical protein [Escherichia coli]
MLLTLRGMFINYLSDTRELNAVAAKLYPLKTSQTPLYAVGVVPARRQPQPGRISALAGRRAAYERVPDN